MLRPDPEPSRIELPIFSSPVQAAFPSRADDHIEGNLDLNQHLVRIRTDPFVQDAQQQSVSGSATFHRSTSDTRDIAAAVLRIFDRIWRDGYGWRKAGVLLLNLGAPGHAPASLFDVIEAREDGLMKAIDQINARNGRGTARLGIAQKNGE